MVRRFVPMLALPLLLMGTVACVPTPADCTSTGATEHRDLEYAAVAGVAPAMVSLDLFTPDRPEGCPSVPVVVYVHGGGFHTGDKANKVEDKVAAFTAEGWAFASVNYRLLADPASGSPSASYPVQPHDVATAVGWLKAHADTYGLDEERVALMGHSAGAFLAAQVGADERLSLTVPGGPGAPACVVPLDTEGYDVERNIARRGAAVWAVSFPDPAARADASPLVQVPERSTPSNWLVVARGARARVAEGQRFVDAVNASGGTASLLDASAYDHAGVNDAIGRDDDQVITPVLLPFLRGCFAE